MNKAIEFQKEVDNIKSQVVGFTYRHFKGGIYIVTDIAVNTETLELEVIYKPVNAPSLVWCRPLSMFLSEVDKEKHPYATQTQKMRFEKIKSIMRQNDEKA